MMHIAQCHADYCSYEYITGPRIQLSPRDLIGTEMDRSKSLHFCCSPARAKDITDQVKLVDGWHPTTIWEPLPVSSPLSFYDFY